MLINLTSAIKILYLCVENIILNIPHQQHINAKKLNFTFYSDYLSEEKWLAQFPICSGRISCIQVIIHDLVRHITRMQIYVMKVI